MRKIYIFIIFCALTGIFFSLLNPPWIRVVNTRDVRLVLERRQRGSIFYPPTYKPPKPFPLSEFMKKEPTTSSSSGLDKMSYFEIDIPVLVVRTIVLAFISAFIGYVLGSYIEHRDRYRERLAER